MQSRGFAVGAEAALTSLCLSAVCHIAGIICVRSNMQWGHLYAGAGLLLCALCMPLCWAVPVVSLCNLWRLPRDHDLVHAGLMLIGVCMYIALLCAMPSPIDPQSNGDAPSENWIYRPITENTLLRICYSVPGMLCALWMLAPMVRLYRFHYWIRHVVLYPALIVLFWTLQHLVGLLWHAVNVRATHWVAYIAVTFMLPVALLAAWRIDMAARTPEKTFPDSFALVNPYGLVTAIPVSWFFSLVINRVPQTQQAYQRWSTGICWFLMLFHGLWYIKRVQLNKRDVPRIPTSFYQHWD